MKTFDEIREFLATKFTKERKRLKTYSAHANMYDLANVVSRHVQSLMAESRYSELKKLVKKRPKLKDDSYIKERLKATSRMATAIQHVADSDESKRPSRPTGQIKEKKRKHKKEKKRGHIN